MILLESGCRFSQALMRLPERLGNKDVRSPVDGRILRSRAQPRAAEHSPGQGASAAQLNAFSAAGNVAPSCRTCGFLKSAGNLDIYFKSPDF